MRRAPRRVLLGAFGDPGHAFPMIALGRELVRAGHEVWLQTWQRWRTHVEDEGMSFSAAPEYHAFPGGPGELGFYEAVECATRATVPLIDEVGPEVVVADILTLAPALAGELRDVPWATLVPHVYPVDGVGLPIYSLGGRLARTRAGMALWEGAKGPMRRGVRQGQTELNATRLALGLPALDHPHGGISRELALVATFPQLEYPRRWPPGVHVTGPLMWEPPAAPAEPPAGEGPLVLIAPSTSQDPGERLVRASLEGLAGAPVRVLATLNRRPPPASADAREHAGRSTATGTPAPTRPSERSAWTGPPDGSAPTRPSEGSASTPRPRGPAAMHASRGDAPPLPQAPNATIVDWLSYARTMPACDLVICHAGHGTLVRALACGCPVLACPAAGDMNENAARLDWAGAGVRLPRRFAGPRAIRLAAGRALSQPAVSARAGELAGWLARHDPAGTAARLVEELLERCATRRAAPSG